MNLKEKVKEANWFRPSYFYGLQKNSDFVVIVLDISAVDICRSSFDVPQNTLDKSVRQNYKFLVALRSPFG